MSPRNYCYDTEFLEDGTTIELISIGIVCDDGREYYAVNEDMPVDRVKADDWLSLNVWKHLPVVGYKEHTVGYAGHFRTAVKSHGHLDRTSTLIKPKRLIANEVREFIQESANIGDDVRLWAYYGAYDHVALAQLFGKMINLPKGIPMFTHELMQLMGTMPGDWQPPAQEGVEHNALADARWNMQVLKAIQEVDQ